jgi:hypothetical protein
VRLNAKALEYKIMSLSTLVRNRARILDTIISYIEVSAVIFNSILRRKKTKDNIKVFSVTIADINKALTVRNKTDLRTKLPKHYY